MRLQPLSAVVLALALCIGASIYMLVQILELRSDLVDTTNRLQTVEAEIRKRENADPLVARECVELGLGTSPEKPCQTTLYRLSQTPQQFHDSWVVVEGIYASGFEHTAVYPLQLGTAVPSQLSDKHAALWVQLGLPDTNSRPVISVVGKFKRGPAGHMGDYFGELVDAKLLRRSDHVTQ